MHSIWQLFLIPAVCRGESTEKPRWISFTHGSIDGGAAGQPGSEYRLPAALIDYSFPNSTKNVLIPFLLSAHIFPLWRFTMDSAIDSPRPKLPVRLLA